MKIRLLYFESCPGWIKTKEYLDELSKQYDIELNYDCIDVNKVKEKTGTLITGFYGSPTINYKFNGVWIDLFGGSGPSMMACRPYTYKEKMTPYIPKELLEKALKKVSSYSHTSL